MDLTAIFVVGFLVLGVYKLVELFARKSERMALIEKLSAIHSDAPLKFPTVYFENQQAGLWPIRISLLLVGIGIGCTVAYIVHLIICSSYSVINEGGNLPWDLRVNRLVDMVYFASISMFGGAGLFIAFLIERKEARKTKE
jgi:hypothetical protein